MIISIYDVSNEYSYSEAMKFSICALSAISDRVLILCHGGFSEEISSECCVDKENIFDDGNAVIDYILNDISEKIIFSKACYYGPVLDWSCVIGNIEEITKWQLGEGEKISDSALWIIDSEYMANVGYELRKGFYLKDDLNVFEEKNRYKNFYKYDTEDYDYLKYRPYDLIISGFPIIYKSAFSECDLDYTMGYQIDKAMRFVKDKYHFDTSIIFRELLKKKNISSLYHVFHWNYVINKKEEKSCITKRTALIICLYYNSTINKNLNYISNAPSEIDVYVILKNSDLYEIVEKYIKTNKLNWTIIISKENRGRDVSALLIEARKVFNEYEYVGFCHDKQTTGGIGADIIGDDFNDLIFENIIGSSNYVRGIITLFEQNKELGLLAPPEIMHSHYFSFIGKEWSNNYDNVKMLCKNLGIDVLIEECEVPYILGTAFWCKSRALKKLINFKWEYSDFPPEPLDLDGTLNHSIERVILYVVQDAGYYSGIVYTDEFAALYLNNMQNMFYKVLNAHRKNVLFSTVSEINCDKGHKLLSFCGNESVYIYGAGGNASRITDYLEANGKCVLGYIVSDGRRERPTLLGKNIYELSEINDGKKIVVSVNKKIQQVIVPLLTAANKDYFCV